MANKGISGLQIDGFKEIYKAMGLVEEEITKAAIKGMKVTALNILGESKKLVPIDTHTLQESGHIKTDTQNQITTISYNTPYAKRIHEDGSLNHSRSIAEHNQGEAKYLERPFNEKKGELEINIGDEIHKVLQKKYPD